MFLFSNLEKPNTMNGKIDDYNDNIWRTQFHYQLSIEFTQVAIMLFENQIQLESPFEKRYKVLEAIFEENRFVT